MKLIAGLLPALLLLCASAPQALGEGLSGAVPDVPTGAHLRSQAAPRATVANLESRGGSVMHSNRTHLIFWVPSGSGLRYDPGYQPQLETFLNSVAADSRKSTNVYSLSGQYNDAGGPAAYDSTYAGSVTTTDPLPGNGCVLPPLTAPPWGVCLNESQLQAEIQHVVAVNGLPTGGRDLYFLATPDGFGSCYGSGPDHCSLGGAANHGICGWHRYTPDQRILYAILPYNAVPPHCQSTNPRPNSNAADPTISSLSHEHNEAVTDPYVSAWLDPSGAENGDLCATSFGSTLGGSGSGAWNQSISGHHYYLQQEWSNDDGACASHDEHDRVSFSKRHLKARRKLRFTGHGRDPDGRIVSYMWFFGDGKTARARVLNHRYKRRGVYRVTLRTTDSSGNWSFSVQKIRVRH